MSTWATFELTSNNNFGTAPRSITQRLVLFVKTKQKTHDHILFLRQRAWN
jgi:hypothetical protein